MEAQEYLDRAKRDALLIYAIHRALYAMELTNGCPIMLTGVNAVLSYGKELAQLQRALTILGVDPGERSPPAPSASPPI